MFFLTLIKSMIFFTGSYGVNVFPPTLTKEEEEKYVDLMLQGDKDARSKLIEHNLRLVAHIVKKFENKNTITDDLISIGTIGLIKGIDTYKKNYFGTSDIFLDIDKLAMGADEFKLLGKILRVNQEVKTNPYELIQQVANV